MDEICSICDGAGLRVVERADGTRVAATCECRLERLLERKLESAHIPSRHKNSTLDNYVPDYDGDSDRSLSGALLLARKFVEGYPGDCDGKGLLLVGSYGVGKSHLAVGILRALIERGSTEFKGLYVDYQELLKNIQDSYGRPDISERQLLAPVFESDVLMIDELGSAKPTEWVWDMVQHILNTRYNDQKTTIITTNFKNERETPMDFYDDLPKDKRDAYKAMHRDNLGDRVTERIRSRLMEMCVVVPMNGKDFRLSEFGKASLKHGKLTPSQIAVRKEKLKKSRPTDLSIATVGDHQERAVSIPSVDHEEKIVGSGRLGQWAASNRKMSEEDKEAEKKRLLLEQEIAAFRRAKSGIL